MPTDYQRSARTSLDREYAYMAWGMMAGAVPGVVAGLVVAAFVGHAAMWVSVLGGVGIVLGLVAGILLHRARHGRGAQDRAASPEHRPRS
ncbi:hypothetical protein AS188_06650 [Kocuria flava]|uniref:Major facilitator superfamily (MFS) profile domain-containing protein n=1 Tax=Kocuria flava TaxID=446860 RepID=A0A0U2NYN4_9MICC|nr:hypothetical protein [Kocuria flava]ALU39485.1 hypothetical protein AS188_06650 [Kocuria flava]GEO91871.1 hypothetical protein KFL01_11770 [Kocuria flava]